MSRVTLLEFQQTGRDAGNWSLSGRTVLLILLLFFGTIGSVNALLVYYALSTFRGEVADHPYEDGLAYNSTIAAARAQQARNWRVDVKLVPDGEGRYVEVSAHDAQGRLIQGLAMSGNFAAPADIALDRRVTMAEERPGVYSARVPVTSGRWDLEIAARRDGEIVFQSKSRILVE